MEWVAKDDCRLKTKILVTSGAKALCIWVTFSMAEACPYETDEFSRKLLRSRVEALSSSADTLMSTDEIMR